MKKLITTILATLVAFFGYAQDYLPLSGGTLTGDLTGVHGIFGGDVIVYGGFKAFGAGGYAELKAVPTTFNTTTLELWTNYGYNTPVKALSIFNGTTTLSGALAGTSATFSGNITTEGVASRLDLRSQAFINFSNAGGGTRWGYIQHDGSNLVYNADVGRHVFNQPFTGTSATFNGDVGIGTGSTTDPQGYKLAVAGKIRATEIKVEALPWPDYVFQSEYKLPDLKATEQFIKENKHLPEIPSAKEVEKEGINLGEMNAKLLQKIEELTLYMIEQNKRIEQLEKQIKK